MAKRDPTSVDVNSATNTIYVTNSPGNRISIIDGKGDKVVKTLMIGNYSYSPNNIPSAIAVNPSTNMVYVTNYRLNSVSIIDGKTDNVLIGAEQHSIGIFCFEFIFFLILSNPPAWSMCP